MPLVVRGRSHWWKWGTLAFACTWVLLVWWISEGRRDWFMQIYPIVLVIQVQGLFISRQVLAGGVLTIVMGNGTVTRIPLAAAELSRKGVVVWHLRWPEGKRWHRRRFKFPESFGAAVERAVQSAREAPEGTVPHTVKDTEKAVTFGALAHPWHWYIVAGLLIGVVLVLFGFWINNPLPLVAVVVLMFLAANMEVKRVMLAGEHLWMLPEKGEPHGIALRTVHAYVEKGSVFIVKTEDPAYPEIRLNALQGADLIRQLKKRLNGEPEGPYGPGVLPTIPEAPVGTRCTLCGRPDPSGARASAVYICETCSGRARVQATEAGHGLGAKETKPL